MANIIEKVQKPTLVLAHNKTLAGQLYSEFKEFFPENAVEYFVSYYDYYQPEAYIPQSDTYIEKDASINDEIDKLRHSATLSLFETRDVIIIASVSCIYGLGDPVDYNEMMLSLRPQMTKSRNNIMKKLINMQYSRNELDFKRGTFRAKGDVLEIYPSSESESAVRVEFWGDEIEKINEINPLTGKVIGFRNHILIPPASQYVTNKDKLEKAIVTIEEEMKAQVEYFKSQGKLIEAQRIEERTNFDIEMMRETGFCQGIENYSRHISGREPGSAPYTLFDYFPKDFLLLIDESHATIPQVKAMYNGDRARKEALVKYGFRLPSAFDNRPLKFEEFEQRIKYFGNHFWLMFDEGKLIAFVDGFVTDEANLTDEMYENASMHNENGAWQMIFGVNTLPEYRRCGYAKELIKKAILDAREQNRRGLVLTCKESLVPYYSKFGFIDEGITDKSTHGNVLWYQMRLDFELRNNGVKQI